jgi:hypothetical protein
MTTVAAGPQSSPLAIFRNRGFLLMWTAQLVSSAGSALTALAASILVYRLTGSALSVGLMMMATALPTLHLAINRVFMSRMTERMVRMNMMDLPLSTGPDQAALRELRTPAPQAPQS